MDFLCGPSYIQLFVLSFMYFYFSYSQNYDLFVIEKCNCSLCTFNFTLCTISAKANSKYVSSQYN